MRRVDGQRGEDGVDLRLEVGAQVVTVRVRQLRELEQADALILQGRADLALEDAGVQIHEVVRGARQVVEQLARFETGRRAHREAGGDAALEARHTHHEELVEVRREDRQEAGALEQRHVRVGRQLQDTLVELQPRHLAVEETVCGQLRLVSRGGLRRLRLLRRGRRARDVAWTRGRAWLEPGDGRRRRRGSSLGRRVVGAARILRFLGGGGLGRSAHGSIFTSPGQACGRTSRREQHGRTHAACRWPWPVRCRPRRRARRCSPPRHAGEPGRGQ